MRVCLISREFPPDTGWGGIATFAYHLACGLKELGHEVEVVSLAKDLAGSVDQDGLRIHRVEPYKFTEDIGVMNMCMPYSCNVIRSSTALWHKFLELHNQRTFDVVDAPELLAEGLYPGVTKLAPLVVRLYTPHSKFIAERLHNVTATFDHEFVALLERMAMLSADVLTSPSNDLADYVAGDLNCARDRIHIVRNPIDPERFSPTGPQALAGSGRPRLLFVGRLEGRKGIHYLVDALPEIISSCPEATLTIIGSDTKNGAGQRSVKAELEASLMASGCRSRVEFIERVPLEDLPLYYRSGDVCVVPSIYDNSPYTCLEAMSCGRAVVGTTGGGTGEYLIHGQSGLTVPPKDSPALARAIISLLNDQAERQRLGDNARNRVLQEFQRKAIARQTVELYELARARFETRAQSPLYRRDPENICRDVDGFLYSYNRTLHDFLYLYSWRYRFKYWLSFTKRPRLLAAKVLVKISNVLFRISGVSSPPLICRLQKQIEAMQDPLRLKELIEAAPGTARDGLSPAAPLPSPIKEI